MIAAFFKHQINFEEAHTHSLVKLGNGHFNCEDPGAEAEPPLSKFWPLLVNLSDNSWVPALETE